MIKYLIFNLVTKGRTRQLFAWLAVCILIAGIISWIGKSIGLPWEQTIGTFLDSGVFGGDAGDAHPTFRLIVALLSIFFISSLLVSVISNVFINMSEAARNGEVYYPFSNFILVFGGGSQLKNILEDYKNTNKRILVVSPSRPNMSGYDYIYYKGERDSITDIKPCRVHKADKIFIIGENNEVGHDAKNIECYRLICSLANESNHAIKCFMTIREYSTTEVFQYRKNIVDSDKIVMVDIINEYEFSAEQFLIESDFLPVIKKDSHKMAHFYILGSGNIAQATAYTVAQLCHYPNDFGTIRPTKISILDKDALSLFERMDTSRPYLFDMTNYSIVRADGANEDHLASRCILDIEWEFIESSPSSVLGRERLMKSHNDINEETRVLICYENIDNSIEKALHLPGRCDDRIPTAVYLDGGTIVVEKAIETGMYGQLYFFGPSRTDNVKESLEKRSMLGKRANFAYIRNYHAQVGKPLPDVNTETIDRLWYTQSESNKYSSIYSANAIPLKRKCFDKDDKTAIYEAEHRRWMMAELIMGYMAGDKTDRARFVHDCIVPFDDLPYEQQIKDSYLIDYMGFIVGETDEFIPS